jgi:MFS family permease
MTSSTATLSFSKTFSALRHRNYRLWFTGQIVMLVGAWMQSTAQGYLVYELTGSTAYLGVVSFAGGIPSWLFTLYGGVIADRFSRRNLMLITQGANMLLALTLATLVFSGVVQPWMIVGLAFLLGTTNAFEGPVRQSFLSELVEREDMANGIALNSSMFNLGTVIGPAAGGMVYAAVGPGWCFLLNGLSFIASLVSLALIRIKPQPAAAQGGIASANAQLIEGLKFTLRHPQIRYLIAGMGMLGMFVFGVLSLLPAWARDVLSGDSTTFGWLNSARGLGSLIGALVLAAISHLPIRGRVWASGALILPVFMFIFATTHWLPASLLMLVGIGLAVIAQGNTANALIQLNVPDEIRGRIMGIFMLVFNGSIPIGALIAGTLAETLDPPATVAAAAGILGVFGAYTWLRRPDLRRMG